MKRGSRRGRSRVVVGLLRTRPVLAGVGQCWPVLRVRGLQAQLHSGGCQVPTLFSSLWPVTLGDVGSRSKCHRPCQGVLRTPSGPPLAASLLTSLSTYSYPLFPRARPAHLGPARPVAPTKSPCQALKPEAWRLLAPRTHARWYRRLFTAPRRERAGGRLSRALRPGSARGSVESPSSVDCGDSGQKIQLRVSGRP